jgi:hypothetical protein
LIQELVNISLRKATPGTSNTETVFGVKTRVVIPKEDSRAVDQHLKLKLKEKMEMERKKGAEA